MISTSTFFASLYTALITPLLAQLQAMIGTDLDDGTSRYADGCDRGSCQRCRGCLRAEDILRVQKDVAIAAIVVVLATSTYYTQYISNLFLIGVPNTLGQALGATTNPASSLDLVLNTVVKATFEDYHQLPWGLMSIPLGLGLIVILVVAITCLLFSFAVYMTATIINVVAVLIGPIFLVLGITPITRRFTAGWFSVLVGGCITQVLSLGVIQLMATAELTMIQGFITAAAPAAGGDNSIVISVGPDRVGNAARAYGSGCKASPRDLSGMASTIVVLAFRPRHSVQRKISLVAPHPAQCGAWARRLSVWPGWSAVKRATTTPGAIKGRSADRSAEEIVNDPVSMARVYPLLSGVLRQHQRCTAADDSPGRSDWGLVPDHLDFGALPQ